MRNDIRVEVVVADDQGLSLRSFVRQRDGESPGDALRRAAQELQRQARALDDVSLPTVEEWDVTSPSAARVSWSRSGWAAALFVVACYALVCALPWLAGLLR